MTQLPHPGSSARTRVRRLPDNAVEDRATLNAILDEGRVAHVAVISDGQPFVVPIAYARDGDRLLLHGSTGSRLFRELASGAATCVTVTLLDGLVCALSAFESSMNYRSAMILGRAHRLSGDEELHAMERLTDHLLPGRWSQVRHPDAKERAATMVLALPLDECSVKVRSGPPEDSPEDCDDPALRDVWAGVVDIDQRLIVPADAPAYVHQWQFADRDATGSLNYSDES